MSRSTFNPENNWKIDEFIEHFDVAYQDLSDMRRYQELMLKSYLSPDEQLELTTITNKQRDKIWMSEDLNVLQDCIVALETFFKDNTIPQLQQFIKDLQAERDSAVGTINTEEAAALAELQRLMDIYSDTIITGAHTHPTSQITGLARVATTNSYNDLTDKPDTSATGHRHTWGQWDGMPTTFPPSTHTHDDRYYTETEMNTKLAAKADNVHYHDERYYTGTEMDTKLNAKSNTGHVHAIADVTGLQVELNGLKSSVSSGKSAVANAITAKGVSTSTTAEFATMANNINALPTIANKDVIYASDLCRSIFWMPNGYHSVSTGDLVNVSYGDYLAYAPQDTLLTIPSNTRYIMCCYYFVNGAWGTLYPSGQDAVNQTFMYQNSKWNPYLDQITGDFTSKNTHNVYKFSRTNGNGDVCIHPNYTTITRQSIDHESYQFRCVVYKVKNAWYGKLNQILVKNGSCFVSCYSDAHANKYTLDM